MRLSRNYVTFVLVLATGAFAAPPTNAPVPASSKAAAASAEEASMFKDIQATYSRGDYEGAIQKLTAFEKKHPGSVEISQAYNLHGLSYLLTKRALLSIHFFKKAIEGGSHSSFREYVSYNLATAQFEANQHDDALKTLNDMQADILDKDTRLKFHFLRIKLFQKKGFQLEAAKECLSASKLFEQTQSAGSFATYLQESLRGVTNLAALEVLYRDFETSPLADILLFEIAKLEITMGRSDAAESRLNALISRFPKSAHYSAAIELVNNIKGQSQVDNRTIGVLLPLKGKFAKYGTKALQGIELGFNIFNANEPDTKVTLVLEDSGEEVEDALRALDNLFFKHHVIAVIGPLMSKGIEQVTQRAQSLGIPLISLAQQAGTPGDFVFQSALTAKLQTMELARYAIDKLNLKRFAILYPKDKFGEQYSQLYWDAVESLGGQVVGIEAYNPGETDFRQPIDRLSGLHYTEARERELEELAKQRQANNIKKRTRKTEQFFALKPIVDYDAVFIPDEPKVVGQILPTFAYRDVEKVKFLGTSTWHSSELLARAQGSAEGAVFVDAFFPQSGSPTVKKFIERHIATFNQEPSSIEALAFDAAKLVEKALAKASTRSEMKDSLMAIQNFQGVTGKISFTEGGFSRNLNVLTVFSGKITEAQ